MHTQTLFYLRMPQHVYIALHSINTFLFIETLIIIKVIIVPTIDTSQSYSLVTF